ncbi:hypothetical protein C6A85_27985, partial [Mycobacterium sp. ITM-2017-0098]
MTAVSSAVANSHHAVVAHEVVLLLATDPHRGLSSAVAEVRTAQFGPNTLPVPPGSCLLTRILRQFHN